MTKRDFLQVLQAHLSQMPPEEREKQLAYYEELIDDMCEDGMTEAEAAAQLGDPALIAEELLSQMPLGELVKSRVFPEGGWTALTIVLLVLGLPVWLPLLLALGAVVLALLIVVWALVLSFGIVVLALGLSVPAAFLGFIGPSSGSLLSVVGAALICGGLCLLGVIAFPHIVRGAGMLCAGLFRWIKSLFIKKEG